MARYTKELKEKNATKSELVEALICSASKYDSKKCKNCKYMMLEEIAEDIDLPVKPDVKKDGKLYWQSCDTDRIALDAADMLKDVAEPKVRSKRGAYKLPDVLRKLMKEDGYTFMKLSNEIDISVNTLNRYATGEVMPGIIPLMVLSDFFDVTTDYLLYGEG